LPPWHSPDYRGNLHWLAAGDYPNVPGIWNEDQIAGWRKVTDAVHAKKSFIFMQLWAIGRAAQGSFKSVSEIVLRHQRHRKPQVLTESGTKDYFELYAQAARNAMAAGFDGVEVHGANGYLVDQCLQDVSKARTDAWGGSIEKRARFGPEIVRAIATVVGPNTLPLGCLRSRNSRNRNGRPNRAILLRS
jgi:NADPH2 dehydrogenase